MNIDSIKNGIVIDHITAGKGMEIYRLLGLEELDCSVALIKNVASKKSGKKDIIKITVVLIDVDNKESIFLTPFFAKIVVNPENTAAKSANKVHI